MSCLVFLDSEFEICIKAWLTTRNSPPCNLRQLQLHPLNSKLKIPTTYLNHPFLLILLLARYPFFLVLYFFFSFNFKFNLGLCLFSTLLDISQKFKISCCNFKMVVLQCLGLNWILMYIFNTSCYVTRKPPFLP